MSALLVRASFSWFLYASILWHWYCSKASCRKRFVRFLICGPPDYLNAGSKTTNLPSTAAKWVMLGMRLTALGKVDKEGDLKAAVQ